MAAIDFAGLSREQVLEAVSTADDNPIADEVARLIGHYNEQLTERIRLLGRVPANITRAADTTPIQHVAIDFVMDLLREETNRAG